MSVSSRKIRAKIRMIEMGIIPAFTGYELITMLNSLNEKERRVAKRKFRKTWKKLLKNNPKITDHLMPESGMPEEKHLRNRSCMVISSIMNETG